MGGRLGTPGAASFFSFSRFLSASGEIFAKQKLTSSLALTYKKFGGPTWTLGSHLTLTIGPGSTGGEKIIKHKTTFEKFTSNHGQRRVLQLP